ncbi:CASP-like protein 1 [Bidens hawaiensis]|uniref:CASP-like protein 1 n=1 Tax=Bidens hawaiensis TaxID=980011 RepID=UPI00404ACC68
MSSINPSHSTISVESPAPAHKFSTGTGTGSAKNHVVIDVVLRSMLFATAFVALIIMVTSKQTKLIPVAPGFAIPMVAKFNQSPALIYYVAALSVVCFYSIITGLLSVLALVKMITEGSTKMLLHFVILDALLLGIMASATGAAGGVGYIGFKGNKHTRWNKICNVYGSFCGHIAGSITVSLLPSIALLLLVWVSVFALSKKISRST